MYNGTVQPDDFTLEILNDYEIENINKIAAYEEETGYR